MFTAGRCFSLALLLPIAAKMFYMFRQRVSTSLYINKDFQIFRDCILQDSTPALIHESAKVIFFLPPNYNRVAHSVVSRWCWCAIVHVAPLKKPEHVQPILLPAFTGYKYVKLSLKSCCSFVCLHRKSVWLGLAQSIPSAVCFALLGACQSG